MATLGDYGTSNQYIKYKIEVNETGTSITNNTSTVNVKVKIWRTNSGFQTYGTGTCYCKINGTEYTQNITPDQKIDNEITIFDKTVEIGHNNDGTKTIYVEAKIEHQRFDSSWNGGNVTLTTIARKSSFASGTSTSGTFGSAITVKIAANSSSFRHKVMFTFGGATDESGYIAAGTNSYTPTYAANTYGPKIPNNTSGSGVLTLITYNGDTEIGRVTQNITMSLPSYNVSCSTPTLAEQNSTVKGLGLAANTYVQGKSTIKVTCGGSTSYGASITKYVVKINGQTYTLQNGTTTVTTGALSTSGTNHCYVTAYDSRGKASSQVDQSFTVKAYSSPKINSFSAVRDSTTTTTIKVSYNVTITSLRGDATKDKPSTVIIEYDKNNQKSTNIENNTTSYSLNTSKTVTRKK